MLPDIIKKCLLGIHSGTTGFTWCLLTAVTLFFSCGTQNPAGIPPPIQITDWDTSFSIGNAHFANDSSIARSVVSNGNNRRLWKFLEKAHTGANVRIGFIGGSIVGGAGASDNQHILASRFCAFTAKLFPQAIISQINAGWGGTNSRFGCSRMQDELLVKAPDLTVIEYAVNDDPSDTFTTMACMEGIVRQCLQKQDMAVLMLFLMNKSGDTVDQAMHSRIGRHYGIPMVSYRDVCWPLVAAGGLPLDSIFADAIHPNNSGHLLCAYLLYSFCANTAHSAVLDAEPALPSPLVSDLYASANIMKTGDSAVGVSRKSGWVESVKEFGRTGYVSVHAGDTLLLTSRVRELTLGYHVSSAHNAMMEVLIDNSYFATVANYAGGDQAGGMMQLGRLFLNTQPAVHTVQFNTLGNDSFQIDYVLYAR
jgi:hypothetical protein